MAAKSEARYADLAALRARRGLSIEQIAKLTKISSRYLKAIEAGEWNELPDGVYRRSYLRQYLAAIDCEDAALGDLPLPESEVVIGPAAPGWFGRLCARLAAPVAFRKAAASGRRA